MGLRHTIEGKQFGQARGFDGFNPRRTKVDTGPTSSGHKKQMKTNQNTSAIATAATATALALWEDLGSVNKVASCIATLCQAAGGDLKAAGAAFFKAWEPMGGAYENGVTTRRLVKACFDTNMDKKMASRFLNAVGLVTKQRIGQLLGVVFDGDASKNRGKDKDKAKSGDESGKGKGWTFDQIMAALQTLPSITKAQASSAAALLASKIA